MDDTATVLIVDDEPAIVDGHAARLEGQYEVRTAYDGHEALERLDEAVDVVLLDRRMPGLSGDEVLDHARDRGLDCRVAMLTGVEPSFDIADMGFDEYLQKPVAEDALFETVERLHRRNEYDETLQEYFSVASRVATLETEHGEDVLHDRDEYRELNERLDALRDRLDRTLEELPADESYVVATESHPTGDGLN
jgi:DNA-binding response OmpR family regulator